MNLDEYHFRSLAEDRVHIEFLPLIKEMETCIEPGMRAIVLSVEKDEDGDTPEDELWMVKVDLEAYAEHNKPLEAHDYYDSNNHPRLSAREAGQYEAQPTFYCGGAGHNEGKYFRVVDEVHRKLSLKLRAQHVQHDPGTSYVTYLEKLLQQFGV